MEDVVARITGADDRGAERRRRGGSELLLGSRLGWDDENSTAYYAYIDGERYVLSKNPHLLLNL